MGAHPILQVPVLFLVFNRPEPTRVVFERIRKARPSSLFVAGDGPRGDVAGEAQRCETAREIATEVDWECRLQTRFPNANLGPGPGVSSAITWFFEHVERGIILEDDCAPSNSFFRFCQELLQRFEDEPRLMHISGHNYQYGRRRGKASYYFSKYPHVGGWATWRRAWQHYDIRVIPEKERDEIWDAAWMFSMWRTQGVAAVPNINLVSNIGFGPDATHTMERGRAAFLPALELSFPLIHATKISVDRAADTLTYYANFRNIPSVYLMWLYQAMDFLRLVPTRLFKLMTKATRKRHLPGRPNPNAK
jgi:hypothetical protein